MVNLTLNNPKPNNNRINAVPGVAMTQGDLMAIDATGELVKADAANGVQGQCQGAALTEAIDLSIYTGTPEEDFLKLKAREEKNVILGDGKRGTAFRNDILVYDTEETLALDPGLPVYLAEGGGVTQTAPATAGSVVQIIGVAQDANSFMLDVQTSDTTV